MRNRIDLSETELTNDKPIPTFKRSVLTAEEMGKNASLIEASFRSVPEFPKIMEKELEFANKVIEGIRSGEISDDMAAKIIAVSKAELEMTIRTDPLTELPNRTAIEIIMREQLALSKRNGTPISIAFADLDYFKDINDRYSHEAGDAVLQGVSGHFTSTLKRPTDEAGRWGGEEFIIVLPETDESGADHVLNDLRQGMNDAVSEAISHIGGYTFDRKITVSVGFVSVIIDKNDTRTIEEIAVELINIADRRMLLAKRNGRNRVVGSLQEIELAQQK